MELQIYHASLREKYQKIMENFTYQGKEPEEKERLRYLFHNQRTAVPSLAPEPQDWNAWTESCIQNADWPGLCRVIHQRGKGTMMPVIYGGYTYEKISTVCWSVSSVETSRLWSEFCPWSLPR